MAKPAAIPAVEDAITIDALMMPDDGDQMQPPQVGDIVSYQKEGKVSRIEGDKVFVTVKSVNGHDVMDGMNEAPEGAADDMDSLMAQAQTMSTGTE